MAMCAPIFIGYRAFKKREKERDRLFKMSYDMETEYWDKVEKLFKENPDFADEYCKSGKIFELGLHNRHNF